ncbi:hypothetical protein [Singulisphaera sp. PoT]|uniref:hypothetical protein n=1 Tax=Singulisphaera sp. PoT TaxID=3411797 RepID=UPI003BF4B088
MDIQPPDTPVFRAFNAELEARGGREAQLDLNVLWDAAGRDQGRSPSEWAAECSRRGQSVTIVEGPKGEALCIRRDFFEYAQHLDPAIELFAIELIGQRLRENPGEAMLKLPTPVMALAAEAAIIGGDGVSPGEARHRIMGDVVAETAGLGPWEQETKVAEVQRAMAGSAPELIPDRVEEEVPTKAEDLETAQRLIGDAMPQIATSFREEAGDDDSRIFLGIIIPVESFAGRWGTVALLLAGRDESDIPELGMTGLIELETWERILKAYAPDHHAATSESLHEMAREPNSWTVLVILPHRMMMASVPRPESARN